MLSFRSARAFALVLLFVSGCGSTTAELWERDSATAKAQCEAMRPTKNTRDLVLNWARGCQNLQRELDQRYGIPSDPDRDAYYAYWIAVYDRAYRGEITFEQADFMVKEFQRRLVLERERLRLEQARVNAVQEQADAAALGHFLQQWNQSFQPFKPSTPIRCSSYSVGRSVYTDCN